MITLEQEKRVRKLLNPDHAYPMTDRHIADSVGIAHGSVQRIRDVRNTVSALHPEKREEIRKLILSGFPLKAIGVVVGVPHDTVIAVRRWFYLMPRKSDSNAPRKCPACGSMIFGDPKDQPSRIHRRGMVIPSDIISKKNAKENVDALYRVATDVCDLDEMCLVHSPLFHHLACRAGEILREINDKSSSNR